MALDTSGVAVRIGKISAATCRLCVWCRYTFSVSSTTGYWLLATGICCNHCGQNAVGRLHVRRPYLHHQPLGTGGVDSRLVVVVGSALIFALLQGSYTAITDVKDLKAGVIAYISFTVFLQNLSLTLDGVPYDVSNGLRQVLQSGESHPDPDNRRTGEMFLREPFNANQLNISLINETQFRTGKLLDNLSLVVEHSEMIWCQFSSFFFFYFLELIVFA